MEIKRFTIAKENIKEKAEGRFVEICGFDLSQKTHRLMLESSRAMREKTWNMAEIRCATGLVKQPLIEGQLLHAGEIAVQCNYFQQIPRETVEGAYFYLLVIDGLDYETEDTTEAVYKDIWGTAIVDASMNALPQYLTKEPPLLSVPMGPGYYGMPLSEGSKIFSILQGEKMGVTMTTGGVMVPEKSCLGIIFQYSRKDMEVQSACRQCVGQKGGCRFCSLYKKA